MNQDLFAKPPSDGGNTTTSFSTGSICPKTGSYKSINKYLEAIIVVVKNAKFPTGTDGKKTTWTSLEGTSSGSSSGGSFESVKVVAGTDV